MSENNLYDGDITRISEHLGCSEVGIRKLRAGSLGKRNTNLQLAIKNVMKYRSEQNTAFEQYCKQLKHELVLLKKANIDLDDIADITDNN